MTEGVDDPRLQRAQPDAGRARRSLVREILSLQALMMFIIGAMAIASLYWGGQWVLKTSYHRWALQWTDELHELGAPLYVARNATVTHDVQSYIDGFPEIQRVSYFRLDGTPLFSIANGQLEASAGAVPSLPDDILEKAAGRIGQERPYVIESSILDIRSFAIHGPIWTESIANDGLFDFENLDEVEADTELVGYISLDLDFVAYHDQLVGRITTTILVLVALLVLSTVVGGHLLRRALRSISDLQEPISKLAGGNLSVTFEPARYREISNIVETLESTVSALEERDVRLSRLADHDALTGLLNRRRFTEELEKAIATLAGTHGQGALLFVDLDRFKYVNDIGGHPAGDRVLVKVADVLRKSATDGSVIARFGGDEFALIATDVSERQATLIAESILDRMRHLKHVEGDMVFHLHASIGIAMFDARSNALDDLVAEADIACREAKARGRNRCAIYATADHDAEQIVSDVGWLAKLREAIDDDTFVLNYQPIVDVATNQISHHEVLLRLGTEGGSMMSPDMFLPVAVRFGLMAEVDTWVIRNSIKALHEFRTEIPDLRFAINLSANAFEIDDLVVLVQSQLAKYEVPANAVVFEITESLAIRQVSQIEYQIRALRDLGCEFALDDFGTGYSSFSHLRQLSADYIKIDGSFIENIEHDLVGQKTVQLIGEIGKASGKRTIAEYVENAASLEIIRDLGIDYAQGFYLGRPAIRPMREPQSARVAHPDFARKVSA